MARLIDLARRLRPLIERAAQSLGDEDALAAAALYPMWREEERYAAGHKVARNGTLYRCRQAHTAQAGWTPEETPALWETICETHSGEVTDPIPYEAGMALTEGLYYTEDGTTYLCTRSTGTPVYHPLAQLVGQYVEEG